MKSKIFDFHFHTIFNEKNWDEKNPKIFDLGNFEIFIENYMKMKIDEKISKSKFFEITIFRFSKEFQLKSNILDFENFRFFLKKKSEFSKK